MTVIEFGVNPFNLVFNRIKVYLKQFFRFGGLHDVINDEVVAVMGVDILLSYFQTVLAEFFPDCINDDSTRFVFLHFNMTLCTVIFSCIQLGYQWLRSRLVNKVSV